MATKIAIILMATVYALCFLLVAVADLHEVYHRRKMNKEEE